MRTTKRELTFYLNVNDVEMHQHAQENNKLGVSLSTYDQEILNDNVHFQAIADDKGHLTVKLDRKTQGYLETVEITLLHLIVKEFDYVPGFTIMSSNDETMVHVSCDYFAKTFVIDSILEKNRQVVDWDNYHSGDEIFSKFLSNHYSVRKANSSSRKHGNTNSVPKNTTLPLGVRFKSDGVPRNGF